MIHFFKRLTPFLVPYRKYFYCSLAFSFFLAGIKAYQAYLVKPIFNRGLGPDASTEDVMGLIIILLLLGLIYIPVRFFHFYWLGAMVTYCSRLLRSTIFKKIQNVPLPQVKAFKSGDIISRLVTDSQVLIMGIQGMVDMVREPLAALALLGVALYIDWQLTVIVALASPLFVVIFNKTGKKVRVYEGNVQKQLAQLTHHIGESIQGQKAIKSLGIKDYMLAKFNSIQNVAMKQFIKAIKVEELASPLVEIVGAFAMVGILLYAHWRINSGDMTTGDFISFMTAMVFLMDPIRKFSRINIRLNQGRAAGERILTLLELPQNSDEGQNVINIFKRQIELRELSFTYEDKVVLDRVSCTIKKGEKVAFVGPSGAGKSTLISLMLRFLSTNEGEITMDGVPINQFKLDSYRSLFGLVDQDIFLFNAGVVDNLKMGANKFSDEEIDSALNFSSSQFVYDLPEETQTNIGNRGNLISGGQKQRLTLARAILQKPSILLLDEATSALDNETEKAIQQAINNLGSETTVIAVAHKLTTIKGFDKIYVLQEGKLIESGSHCELMNINGVYKKLFDLGS